MEDEVQEAVAYVCRMHTLWDKSRTTGTFLDHAWYQLTNYYVNGDAPRRRIRQARHDNACEDSAWSVDKIQDRAADHFDAADERLDAEAFVSSVLPGLHLEPIKLAILRLCVADRWITGHRDR